MHHYTALQSTNRHHITAENVFTAIYDQSIFKRIYHKLRNFSNDSEIDIFTTNITIFQMIAIVLNIPRYELLTSKCMQYVVYIFDVAARKWNPKIRFIQSDYGIFFKIAIMLTKRQKHERHPSK